LISAIELARSRPDVLARAQAITDHRARLSNSYSSDPLQMDEQNIIMAGTNNTVICPSNGYTFQRTPTQASHPATRIPRIRIAATGCTRLSLPGCGAIAPLSM